MTENKRVQNDFLYLVGFMFLSAYEHLMLRQRDIIFFEIIDWSPTFDIVSLLERDLPKTI